MTLKVYATHWSDNKERWGKPNWTNLQLANLGLPFGYFLAPDQETAEEYIKTLPNMPDMVFNHVKTPFGFYLGSFPHTEIVYRKD